MRVTARPGDVFLLAAAELVGVPDWTDARVAELARQRARAEKIARAAIPSAECTFDEIQTELAKLTDSVTAERFAAAELATERAVIRPVRMIADEIAAARARGERVAFVSDMYLPSGFLHELLLTNGLARPDEPVFVSCEHRTNKHGGGLFDVVAQALDASPAAWTHHGDHGHSDYLVPRGRGIAVRPFRRGDFTAIERTLVERQAHQPRASSQLLGLVRAARLSVDPAIPDDRAALLAGVVAPWLCALTARTLRRAYAAGVRRLYFLSRDAEVLLRIARHLAPAGLECRYLFSSRRAWCRAAMLADDDASWRWLRTGSPSPATLLRSLGFDDAERNAILGELALNPGEAARTRPAAELDFVWDLLRRTNRLGAVLARASAAREPLVAYLRQEGLFDDTPSAIVDVGWSLNSQAALNRIRSAAGAAEPVAGYYFMARTNRPPLAETGPFDTWLLEDCAGSSAGTLGDLLGWLSGLVEEFFLTNPAPSLAGYRIDPAGKAQVEFADNAPDAATADHAEELRSFAEALARELARFPDDAELHEALERQALAELIRFLRSPTAAEARVLTVLAHATDATASTAEAKPLARSYGLGDAAAIILRRARLRKTGLAREPLWHEGSLALTNAVARRAFEFAKRPLRRR